MVLTASRPDEGRINSLKPEIYGPGLWQFTALVYGRNPFKYTICAGLSGFLGAIQIS